MSGGQDLSGKHLYLDCFAGCAGDMFLGAMIDLGVPEAELRDGLARLPLSGYKLQVTRRSHFGISGCDVQVHLDGGQREGHDHGGHGHRSWAAIRSLISDCGLETAVKQRALDIFSRVARAEGQIHGVPEDAVTFHEVGAIDSIVDIVGAAIALSYLAPARVTSRPVPLGRGSVRCAHGVLPVPSPAALAILRGAQVQDGGVAAELCTPTGAAIIAHCAQGFGPLPTGTLVSVGYGAGDNVLPDRPNHLRALLLETAVEGPAEQEAVVLEANVDDMPPEWCGYLLERLFAAGALDVWLTPIVMKKGRPALTVAALCPVALQGAVADMLLAESTSIGLRFRTVGRQVLARRLVSVETPYGPQTVKVALAGEKVINVSPEYEQCRASAATCGVPLKEVWAAAIAAYRALADPRADK